VPSLPAFILRFSKMPTRHNETETDMKWNRKCIVCNKRELFVHYCSSSLETRISSIPELASDDIDQLTTSGDSSQLTVAGKKVSVPFRLNGNKTTRKRKHVIPFRQAFCCLTSSGHYTMTSLSLRSNTCSFVSSQVSFFFFARTLVASRHLLYLL